MRTPKTKTNSAVPDGGKADRRRKRAVPDVGGLVAICAGTPRGIAPARASSANGTRTRVVVRRLVQWTGEITVSTENTPSTFLQELGRELHANFTHAVVYVRHPVALPNPIEWWQIAIHVSCTAGLLLAPAVQKVITDVVSKWTRRWTKTDPDRVGREVTIYGPNNEVIKTIRVEPKNPH